MRRYRRWRRLPMLSTRLWYRRLAFWTGAVLVSAAAIGFAALADLASRLFLHATAGRPWVPFLLAPAGLAMGVFLTRAVFPGAQGSGIPQVIAALHLSRGPAISAVLSLRVAAGKVLLTLLGLACGASIGREGPTVQVGAALMHALGGVLRLPREDAHRALVLAGGAAGVAAAFNTPIAGLVFAIEELSHSFNQRTAGVVLAAVVIAGVMTAAISGDYSYFGATSVRLDVGIGWVAVLVCGLAGGLAGGVFSASLIGFQPLLSGRVGRRVAAHPIVFAAACGVALALLGWVSGGATFGTGYAQARGLVAGGSDLGKSFFVLKLLATVVSYLSGVPGGIFAPSLSVGAGLGAWLSPLLPAAPPAAVVVLGMVAYFSGVVQAPITAAIIVMEMTDNQRMTVPLMATALLAFAASRLVCRRPLYGVLAQRFLVAAEKSAPLP